MPGPPKALREKVSFRLVHRSHATPCTGRKDRAVLRTQQGFACTPRADKIVLRWKGGSAVVGARMSNHEGQL
jgi:hypothetical protein